LKKGSVLDLGFLSLIIFSLAFSILFSLTMYNLFYDTTIDMVNADSYLNQSKFDIVNEISLINERMLFNFDFFDKVTFMFFIVLFISTTYFALNLNTHPVYFISSIFTLMIVTFMAWFVQQMYITSVGIDIFTSAGNSLVYITLLLTNLPMIIVLLFIILSVVIYSNVGNGGLNLVNNY